MQIGSANTLPGAKPRVDNNQAQVDPIMSPADQFQGPAGDQRIMVHAGAEQTQAAFAAQRVVSGQNDDRIGTHKLIEQQLREKFPKIVNLPFGVANLAWLKKR